MDQFSNSIVDIHYQQTGAATAVNTLGMREMQALAYEARDKRFLLIKAPPASGKSRALMYIALDKLCNQEIDALKTANSNLQTQVLMRDLAASQAAQTSALMADNNAQTQYVVNRVAPNPIPSYQVTSPYSAVSCGCGCTM